MKEQLDEILNEALLGIEVADDTDKLTAIKVAYLGKSGKLTGVMKNMRDVQIGRAHV